jgi:hypothetical protein
MAGQDMLSFIDLACTAVERHPPITYLDVFIDGLAEVGGTHSQGMV